MSPTDNRDFPDEASTEGRRSQLEVARIREDQKIADHWRTASLSLPGSSSWMTYATGIRRHGNIVFIRLAQQVRRPKPRLSGRATTKTALRPALTTWGHTN